MPSLHSPPKRTRLNADRPNDLSPNSGASSLPPRGLNPTLQTRRTACEGRSHSLVDHSRDAVSDKRTIATWAPQLGLSGRLVTFRQRKPQGPIGLRVRPPARGEQRSAELGESPRRPGGADGSAALPRGLPSISGSGIAPLAHALALGDVAERLKAAVC